MFLIDKNTSDKTVFILPYSSNDSVVREKKLYFREIYVDTDIFKKMKCFY